MSLTLSKITKALRISRPRVEQWISRGYLRTPDNPLIGTARNWDVGDVMRLAVMRDLVDANMSPEQAGQLVGEGFHGFKDGEAYFVVYQGQYPTRIDPHGRTYTPKRQGYHPGIWLNCIVHERDLMAFIGQPDVFQSVVINLDHLEGRVLAALGGEPQ